MIKCDRFLLCDIEQIHKWQEARGLQKTPYMMLPEIGFIVSGVAAGFLYKTDSSICMFDGFIANHEIDADIRKAALDKITDALIGKAKDLGFKQIMAFTKNKSIKNRCKDYSFKEKELYNLFVWEG